MTKIKEKTIQAIESLEPNELLIIYDIIKNYTGQKEKTYDNIEYYKNIRKILNRCKGSISNDIIKARGERI
mgnify:CR=1 FL=1